MTNRTTTVPLPEPLARTAGPLRRAGWLAGLPALALIWAGAALTAGPTIAARIEAEGAAVAAGTETAAGEPWLRVEVRGRDLVAAGEAPDVGERQAALERLAALDGPRRIVSVLGLVETAAPFQWAAVRTGAAGVALEGSRPAEFGRRTLEARVAAALPAGTRLDDAARAARGAPAGFAEAAAYLAARLPGLAAGGRATLSDTVLGLSGEALDVPAYDALRAALAEPPAGFSVGRIEVLPPRVGTYRFAVERSAAGLRLDGYVPSEALRAAARAAAADVAAGAPVEDRLHTARGLDATIDPQALAAFAFRLAGLIQSGTVAFADGAVSVAGDAIDGQAIPEARALMREGRPAGVGAGPVTLAERPLSPYRVAIRRGPDAVTLTGHLPDAATRERVLAALRPRLYREPVIDRTRLADGAPADLAGALAAAAPMLANLAAGEVAVSDRTVLLTGESLYRESAARASEALRAALPPGWDGRAAVAPRQPAERRDADACRADLAAATGGPELRFPAGSAVPGPGFYPVLDAVAALARACPSLRVAVSAPPDPARPKAAPAEVPPAHTARQGATDTGAPVRTDAEPDPAKAAEQPANKRSGDKRPTAEPAAAAKGAKPGSAPRPPAPTKPATAVKDAADVPAADLARQRAQALVEYLLQAGAQPNQVGIGPDDSGGRVVFAPQP